MVDSAVCRGIGKPIGVAKIKHLDTRTLWVQHELEDKTLVTDMAGEANRTDLGTETFDAERLHQLCIAYGISSIDKAVKIAKGHITVPKISIVDVDPTLRYTEKESDGEDCLWPILQELRDFIKTSASM